MSPPPLFPSPPESMMMMIMMMISTLKSSPLFSSTLFFTSPTPHSPSSPSCRLLEEYFLCECQHSRLCAGSTSNDFVSCGCKNQTVEPDDLQKDPNYFKDGSSSFSLCCSLCLCPSVVASSNPFQAPSMTKYQSFSFFVNYGR